jgi:integrating conjugative element protein (TIGR03757 family)
LSEFSILSWAAIGQDIDNIPESVTMNHTMAELLRPQLTAISLLLAASLGGYADEGNKDKVLMVELFTSSQSSTNRNSSLRSGKGVGVETIHYEIDRISQLQSELSQGLPKDAEQAKQLVLQRFQSMDASVSQRLENSAKGLAQALHYGIDHTPAIVFDGQAVIYGVTDVDEAIKRYTQWHVGASR